AMHLLDRRERAEGAAPAATSLEEQPADERQNKRRGDHRGDQVAAMVKKRRAQADEDDERGRGDGVAPDAKRRGQRPAERHAERARKLVQESHRADVAPDAGREGEEKRQARHDDAPEERESLVRPHEQKPCDAAGHAERHHAEQDSCPLRDTLLRLRVVAKDGLGRAHRSVPCSMPRSRRLRTRPRSSRMSRAMFGSHTAMASNCSRRSESVTASVSARTVAVRGWRSKKPISPNTEPSWISARRRPPAREAS